MYQNLRLMTHLLCNHCLGFLSLRLGTHLRCNHLIHHLGYRLNRLGHHRQCSRGRLSHLRHQTHLRGHHRRCSRSRLILRLNRHRQCRGHLCHLLVYRHQCSQGRLRHLTHRIGFHHQRLGTHRRCSQGHLILRLNRRNRLRLSLNQNLRLRNYLSRLILLRKIRRQGWYSHRASMRSRLNLRTRHQCSWGHLCHYLCRRQNHRDWAHRNSLFSLLRYRSHLHSHKIL